MERSLTNAGERKRLKRKVEELEFRIRIDDMSVYGVLMQKRLV